MALRPTVLAIAVLLSMAGCGAKEISIGGKDVTDAGPDGAGAGGASSSSGTTTASSTGGTTGTGGAAGSGTGGAPGVLCGSKTCGVGEHCCTNPVGPNQVCTPTCTTDPCLGAPCVGVADAAFAEASSGFADASTGVAEAGVIVDSGSRALALSCWRDQMPFPSLDTGCNVQSDCFIALHTTDCCGSIAAFGVNASAKTQFQSAETSCGAGICECAPKPTLAQDGRSVANGNIAVQCSNRTCLTWVP
jgi:hypothetical protein